MQWFAIFSNRRQSLELMERLQRQKKHLGQSLPAVVYENTLAKDSYNLNDKVIQPGPAVIDKFRAMSTLDLVEKIKAQDGKICLDTHHLRKGKNVSCELERLYSNFDW